MHSAIWFSPAVQVEQIAKRPPMSASTSYDVDRTSGVRPANDSMEVDREAVPLDMLTALFEARGWPCEVAASEISGQVQGSWTTYQVKGIWRAEDRVLQIVCLPEISVPKGKRAASNELVALANEQIWLGHFDIWSSGGVVLYRNGTMLGDDGLLSLAQAQALVEIAIDECDRFYPAFQFVLWGDKSPRDALEAAMVDALGEA